MALSVDIRKALGNFHLAVQFDAGDETLALLGASGCGKSVTLKCIAGILTPDEGHIELDGVTLYDSASRINLPPQRRQVGYLFQQYALFPNMTVRQNIAAAVRDKARRQTEVAEKLRQFRLEAVFLPDWGLTLSCGRPVPEGVCRIGIRAHHVQLAGPGAENAFSCTAVKVVEDVFSTIVLLRPEGAAPEAPLLRMELDKDNWQAVPDKDRLTVSVPPEAILLLES